MGCVGKTERHCLKMPIKTGLGRKQNSRGEWSTPNIRVSTLILWVLAALIVMKDGQDEQWGQILLTPLFNPASHVACNIDKHNYFHLLFVPFIIIFNYL